MRFLKECTNIRETITFSQHPNIIHVNRFCAWLVDCFSQYTKSKTKVYKSYIIVIDVCYEGLCGRTLCLSYKLPQHTWNMKGYIKLVSGIFYII